MPGMSGPELAQELRGRLPGLPLLFISGLSRPQEMPADADFLPKPFTMAGLTEAVNRVVARRPLREGAAS